MSPSAWWTAVCSCVLFAVSLDPSAAGEIVPEIEAEWKALHQPPVNSGLELSYWGLTRQNTPLFMWRDAPREEVLTGRTRILLVGGLDGSWDSVRAVRDAVSRWAERVSPETRKRYSIAAIPCVNPDGLRRGLGAANDSKGQPDRGYPPAGPAYVSATDPESSYLWRWLGMLAPDLVVEVRHGETTRFWLPEQPVRRQDLLSGLAASWQRLKTTLPVGATAAQPNELVAALVAHAPCDTASIPALRVETSVAGARELIPTLLTALEETKFPTWSPARRELMTRLRRSPRDVGLQLSEHYGHELKAVEYIPALALLGRVRVGEQTGDPQPLADVERIVGPYVRGEQPTTPKSGSGQSGHLIFVQLARSAPDERRARYIELVRVAADQMFDGPNSMKEVMPFHLEMSDALFMGGPILAAAGRLSGESKYFEACERHTKFMQNLVLRRDGIYRHSPLDEAAWGRGNGFPALGLAWCVSEFPSDHPQRAAFIERVRNHLLALQTHQDADGMWHQVIDHPESYRELSCTCMIAWAMTRGIREGWLEREQFEPSVVRAWEAIRRRVATDGRLVDVCTGTGKQTSLRAYYDREALLGRDPRGGAMALMISTELHAAQSEGKLELDRPESPSK